MVERTNSTTIYMSEELYRHIQLLADAEGRTFSAMADRTLRGHMEESKVAANG